MDLVKALAPAFAVGFALQRLIEILDPLVNLLVGEEKKKILLGFLSLVIGLGLAYALDLFVLTHLGVSGPPWLRPLDYLVAGLFVSAGTEGFNSLLKFLANKKEESKAQAITARVKVKRDFNSDDAMDIAYKSVTKTTGSTSPIDPEATLEKYNMKDPDAPSIKNKILNNASYGLPAYGRSMDPAALNGLSSGWTLGELADVIYEQSY